METLEPTPTTSGIASGRKSSGRISLRVRLAAAIAASRVLTAQMPTLASSTPRIPRPGGGEKKSANAGSATSSIRPRKTNTAADFPSQIALRSDGASTSPSSAPPSRSGAQARASPSSARKTSATQRRPCAKQRSPSAPVGSAKWKTTSVERTKSSIAERVPRLQLEPQVLGGERGDVGEVAYMRASVALAYGSTWAGSWVVSSTVSPARPASWPSSSSPPRRAP